MALTNEALEGAAPYTDTVSSDRIYSDEFKKIYKPRNDFVKCGWSLMHHGITNYSSMRMKIFIFIVSILIAWREIQSR